MQRKIYSDLAIESANIIPEKLSDFSEYSETSGDGVMIQTLTLGTPELAEKYSKPEGRYVTVTHSELSLMSEDEIESLAAVISAEIEKMIFSLYHRHPNKNFSVLAVGIGNDKLTPDAIGPQTVAKLTVTRHLSLFRKDIFESLGNCTVSAFSPSVLAHTGIETLELIKGAVKATKPDIVVAIDALAARSTKRLATTVQLSDTGISPGAGIGNKRSPINKNTLGVPVIALGVPTVIDSSTLVYDAFDQAGLADIPKELSERLDSSVGFFVSPKECDVITERSSHLLALALDRAFSLE